MKYRIGICEDRETDRSYLSDLVRQWARERSCMAEIRTFASGEQFLFQYEEAPDLDILLLDIEMGAVDGVTLAKKLREKNDAVQIVFTTGFPDYIGEGYEVAALHYLMKPIRREKLFPVLDRGAKALGKRERAILLPVAGETLRLPVDSIQYVEAFSHSTAVALGERTVEGKLSISEMERLLGDTFIRCHRSYLVSLKYISRISKSEIVLDSGKRLPLSRSASPAVHKAFIAYYTGEDDETV